MIVRQPAVLLCVLCGGRCRIPGVFIQQQDGEASLFVPQHAANSVQTFVHSHLKPTAQAITNVSRACDRRVTVRIAS